MHRNDDQQISTYGDVADCPSTTDEMETVAPAAGEKAAMITVYTAVGGARIQRQHCAEFG
ncbi:MAG: hypothetical protein KDB27_15960 [Planctomycetales bacterium]|nr:hypothetical protein [Planctomycetales bacterium]